MSLVPIKSKVRKKCSTCARYSPARNILAVTCAKDKVLNLHAIDLPDNSVATVLSFDTLEHVEDPRLAMQEIHRVLQPGGVVVITSVMDFPIHEFPYDYCRFKPEVFKSILKPFQSSFVGWQGKELFPHAAV
jgi:SAM-dependent methyltransferase